MAPPPSHLPPILLTLALLALARWLHPPSLASRALPIYFLSYAFFALYSLLTAASLRRARLEAAIASQRGPGWADTGLGAAAGSAEGSAGCPLGAVVAEKLLMAFALGWMMLVVADGVRLAGFALGQGSEAGGV